MRVLHSVRMAPPPDLGRYWSDENATRNDVVIVPCDYAQNQSSYWSHCNHTRSVLFIYVLADLRFCPSCGDRPFEIGKAQYFSEGTDVSIFACGHLVWNAIQAGAILQEKGISVEVINIHTIKPLDEEAVLKSIRKNKMRRNRRRAQHYWRIGRCDCTMCC